MKKHKSVVAILLAVMMIFTFMPAMSFAATVVPANDVKTWTSTDTYAQVTDTEGHKFGTSRVLNSAGYIVATAQDDTALADKTYEAPHWNGETTPAVAYYYDLDSSKFVYGTKALDGTKWTSYANFENELLNNVKLQVQEPSYTDAMVLNPSKKPDTYPITVNLTKNADGTLKMTGVNNRTFTFTMTEYDATKATQDQDITIEVKENKADNAVNVKALGTADVLGTIAKATVTIKGTPTSVASANYYWDNVGGAAFNNGLYTGAAHTIVADPVDGYTVSWQVYNATSGKWDPADAVTLTDAGTVDFKAIWTKTSTGVEESPITKTAAIKDVKTYGGELTISWDQSQNEVDSKTAPQYTVPGAEYDAMNYVVVQAKEKKMIDGETSAQTTARLAQNAAVAAAVEANTAELKAYLNDYFTVKETTTKAEANAGKATFQITAKDLSASEKTELTAKYKKLVANFGTALTATGVIDTTSKATIVLNGDANKDDEVTFTKAITSKTYKGSKTTKKGKLKKNQTIQFKAEAASGKAVTYKLVNVNTSKIKIDKATGKLTLKKGLAKGTYKFIVKAYVPTSGVSMAFETQNVTIKIKK